MFVSVDGTFFEMMPYFHKSFLQVENLSDDRFLDFDISSPSSLNIEPIIPPNFDVPYIEL